MNRLPEPCLLRIFDFLTPFERKSVNQICTEFYKLLQLARYNATSVLDLYFAEISSHCEPWTVLAKSTRKFTHLNIKSSQCLDEDELAEFLGFFGANIECLTLGDLNIFGIGEKHDLSLFFPSLKKLELATFEMLFKLKLPVSVEYIFIDEPVPHMVSPRRLAEFQLLNIKFLAADEIELQNPLFWGKEKNVKPVALFTFSEDLTELLNRHEMPKVSFGKTCNLMDGKPRQLSEVHFFSYDFKIADLKDSFLQLVACTNLDRISLTGDETTHCFFIHETFPWNRLKSVILCLLDMSGPALCPTCLNKLKESCPNFENYGLVGAKDSPGIQYLLYAAPKPLKLLTVEWKTGNIPPLIMNFPALEILQLEGKFTVDTDNWAAMPHLNRIHFDSRVKIKPQNFATLLEKCNNVELATFGFCLSKNQLLELESKWAASLKRLVLNLDGDVSPYHAVDIFRGDFKQLRSLQTCGVMGNAKKFGTKHLMAFQKFPTLREVFNMIHLEYCLYLEQEDDDESDELDSVSSDSDSDSEIIAVNDCPLQ